MKFVFGDGYVVLYLNNISGCSIRLESVAGASGDELDIFRRAQGRDAVL